ncbi:NAC domain-containing protein 35 isoform X1 [Dendrobium catenatum]|uniref:NAC domain-containing protein 94 n=1 Tax=Dendrobium catenatum TaxID=906689 RepID=A0A2I0VV14_9ASPA|nr:NAC domain-containing protein 35 isoform X1 [Dendrobium catenatum]PKU67255.1 Putative NAC domain-containing protein 94 [Dendrobium catenatum]
MAIAAAMRNDEGKDVDGHEHDLVMPGFRFHPTEEELIEFYLRRKVEGKRFNVELITFLDLYRYDPWELPALAAIGEKEWFFYVPRDRKYRNGDRPNRVTTSGYWKATGADRMIRNENFRSIGLKKTLVFYTGKAPKGIRTSWIMNEYRLPQSETDRFKKAEISLCRVYKRAGVDENRRLPPCKTSSLKHSTQQPSSSFTILEEDDEIQKFDKGHIFVSNNIKLHELYPITSSLLEEDHPSLLHSNNADNSSKSSNSIVSCHPMAMGTEEVDELQRLVGYNNHSFMPQNNEIQNLQSSQYQLLHPSLNSVHVSLSTISEKLWEWNAQTAPAAAKDHYINNIK